MLFPQKCSTSFHPPAVKLDSSSIPRTEPRGFDAYWAPQPIVQHPEHEAYSSASSDSSPRGGTFSSSSTVNSSTGSLTSFSSIDSANHSPPHSYSQSHYQEPVPYQHDTSRMNAAQGYPSHPPHGYMDNHHASMGHGQAHTSAPSYGSYHQQPPMLPPSYSSYPPPAPSYHYYGPPATTAAHHQPYPQSHAMALPTMSTTHPPHPQASYQSHTPDTTGQVAPPNHKPKLTGTVWEDEGTVCFQVEVRGICVARREDNCFINGTKLLNVANMTRGRRDGILKSEKTRNVIKIGPMHLKGVWIPFERALEFANKEKITEQLYPLFVSNINRLLAPHFNHLQPNQRRAEGQNGSTAALHTPQSSAATAAPHLAHSSSAPTDVAGQDQSSSAVTSHTPSRPGVDRTHTWPTPPTSATSTGAAGHSGNYGWDPAQPNSSSLQVDTGLTSHVKSLPSTPTTTPPEQQVSNTHYQPTQAYDASRHVYSAAPTHSQYATTPSLPAHSYNSMQPPRKNNDVEAEHQRDFASQGYGHSGYAYGDHNSVAADVKASPSHHSGSGRETPRAMGAQQNHWSGYSSPQRQVPSSSNIAYVMGDGTANGYAHYTNGAVPSGKRVREVDDEDDYASDMKKQKLGRENSVGMGRSQPGLVQRQ